MNLGHTRENLPFLDHEEVSPQQQPGDVQVTVDREHNADPIRNRVTGAAEPKHRALLTRPLQLSPGLAILPSDVSVLDQLADLVKQGAAKHETLLATGYALIEKLYALDATKASDPEIGCLHIVVVQHIFRSQALAALFEVEDDDESARYKAYKNKMKNKLMDAFAQGMKGEKYAMRQFVDTLYHKVEANLTRFHSPRLEDVPALLYWCKEIAENLPGLQYVEGDRCTQRLLARAIEQAGNVYALQARIFEIANSHPRLQQLLQGYRMYKSFDNFTMPLYAAVRALQEDQKALYDFVALILNTGSSHALIGLSFCWHESVTTTQQSTKPNYFNGEVLYSVLTLVIHRLNQEYRRKLLFEIMNAFKREANKPEKEKGFLAFVYNLSKMQPDIKEEASESKFQVKKKTILTMLMDALVEPKEIEECVIFWFSLPVKIASFFFGNITNPPSDKNEPQYPVEIFRKKLQTLPLQTITEMQQAINASLAQMKTSCTDQNAQSELEKLQEAMNAVFETR